MGEFGELLKILDLNELFFKFVNPLLDGLDNLLTDVIIVLTLITAIVTLITALRSRGNISSFIMDFFDTLIKFSVLLIIVKSNRTIIDSSMKLFINIGTAFGGKNVQFKDSFDFNYLWGQLGELLGAITKASLKFKGGMAIFYGLLVLIMMILVSLIIVVMFSTCLTYYLVSTFAILTLPLNIFTPVSDLSKQVIKAWIISGLTISIFTGIINITISSLEEEAKGINLFTLSPLHNDLIGAMSFILFLGLIVAVFLSLSDISNFILKGHGQGFSFGGLGRLVQSGVNAGINMALIATAVYTGGTTAAVAGAKTAGSGAKAGAETAKQTYSQARNIRRASRMAGNTVNKGVATATDSEHKKNTKGEKIDNLKEGKDLFNKGKD